MADDEELFTRAEARDKGLTDRQITRRLKSGTLVAARRGILRRGSGPQRESVSDRSPAVPVDVKAALLTSPSRELVVSHATAARLLGLPKPLAGWPRPQFTATDGPTRNRSGIQIKVATLEASQVIEHLGIAVTTMSRTLADCLRTLPGRDSLAMLDHALNRGSVDLSAVLEVVRQQARWRGVAIARQVVARADARRESPLESWSAWAFAHTDVPVPEWQVEVHEPDGQLIGRADCWWSAGVVGEADGRSKYALAAAERGGDAAAVYRVLQAERKREQRLRDVGAEVVRWSSEEVLDKAAAHRLAQRIAGALAQARAQARFTGVIAPTMLQASTDERPDPPSDCA